MGEVEVVAVRVTKHVVKVAVDPKIPAPPITKIKKDYALP